MSILISIVSIALGSIAGFYLGILYKNYKWRKRDGTYWRSGEENDGSGASFDL